MTSHYAVSHVSTAVSTANQEVFHETERDLEDKMKHDEARAQGCWQLRSCGSNRYSRRFQQSFFIGPSFVGVT